RVRLSSVPPSSTAPTSCSIDFVFSRFESIHPPVIRPGWEVAALFHKTLGSTGFCRVLRGSARFAGATRFAGSTRFAFYEVRGLQGSRYQGSRFYKVLRGGLVL